ncbi:MAG: ABC transporter ATP-binding protein [Elusimicrobiota bacterium]
MAVIEAQDLVKEYGKGDNVFRALDTVSFSIPAGEYAAIMGPSGCGKSTLLNLLGLMDTPTSGSYRLDGQQAEGLDDGQRTCLRRGKLGFVFQSFNLLPRMTALQNVCLPMNYAGITRDRACARAAELLARVGLGGKNGNTPLELSGGERQRVGIARALANSPSVLLADEPTGNLDSRTAVEILDLFDDLHREGMTLLVVTHAKEIADRAQHVLHMKDGRLLREERSGVSRSAAR